MILFILSIFFALIGLAMFVSGERSKPTTGGLSRSDIKLGGSVLFTIAISLFALSTVAKVSNGTVGIENTFGSVSDEVLSAGVHFVGPFTSVEEMDIQTDEIKETMDVPTKEGLSVALEASIIYHLDPRKAANVYRTVGRTGVFEPTIIVPQFRSVLRGVTSDYDAKALYTSSRDSLQVELTSQLERLLAARGVIVESVLLRKITLPEAVQASIAQKVSAEQDAQKMEFVLQKERQEAQRKTIEAQGISDFQQIVTKGISPELLKWKGIEATLELAQSNNAKVVIIGGKDGMPLILNGNQ